MQAAEQKEFSEFSRSNAGEILLWMLSSGYSRLPGSSSECASTHPLVVGDRSYRPCELTIDRGGLNPRSPVNEVKDLYSSLEQEYEIDSFWLGMDGILGRIDGLLAAQELGRYGLVSLFHALAGIGPVRYYTHNVPKTLQVFVETKKFYRTEGVIWDFTSKSLESDRPVHPYLYHAFVSLQRGLDSAYWAQRIETDEKFAIFAFKGLAYCDLEAAEKLLEGAKKLETPEFDIDDADIHIRSARRAREKLKQTVS